MSLLPEGHAQRPVAHEKAIIVWPCAVGHADKLVEAQLRQAAKNALVDL